MNQSGLRQWAIAPRRSPTAGASPPAFRPDLLADWGDGEPGFRQAALVPRPPARRWGYVVALLAAIIPLVLVVVVAGFLGAGILYLLFQVALVALLLHPQSRDYYRLWYR